MTDKDLDFSDLSPEEVIARCKLLLGCRTPEQIAQDEAREQERYEKEQEQYAAWYAEGVRYVDVGFSDIRTKRLYKRTCPVCGTVFYTLNERRKYDDYYECSRFIHRENARKRREENRASICECCGKKFTPDRAGAKYCSAACKQKAYRGRKRCGQNDHTGQP